MQNFKLRKHQVTEADYKDNGGVKERESTFEISGSILLPKNGKGIIFEQVVHLGKPEEDVYLYLKTYTLFNQVDDTQSFSLEKTNKECYPMAEKLLKETVKNVTEAYGMPVIDLIIDAKSEA